MREKTCKLYYANICNQRSQLLSQMKREGLPSIRRQCVFDAVTLSRVSYATPVWRGYLSATEI